MSGAQTGTGAVHVAPPFDVDTAAAKLLDSAAARIIDGGWTQGAAARDRHNMGVAATSDRAVSWCATGAIAIAMLDTGIYKLTAGTARHHRPEAIRLRAEAALKVAAGIEFITGWNDRRCQTAANVACAMRKAATGLRAAPTDEGCR